jgi:gliding motility-associated-like protein
LKRILSLLLVITVTLLTGFEAKASHGMGGEITWQCLPSGQFKFRMKFYRDCNGINAPASINLTTTVPGVPTIVMPRITINDISPQGIPAPGVGSCPDCSPATGAAGLVEEHIYESAPVTLNGTPPAGGWQFYWGECCRSGSLNNITAPGSTGFRNRAIMYPYQARNMNPCYDSSPFFAEKPSTIICTGYPFKYNPNAIDPELDSLTYEWGQPLNDAGNPVTFAPGYNLNSQLPSPTQNPLNVAAQINQFTGEITYTSYTGGYFATVVKVNAFKCGTKVAEIFREINVVLNNSCPPVQGGVQNLPPIVDPPFVNPATGLYTSYIDTVYAGDTVNFVLTATDFQFFNNFGNQVITVEASGSQFGTNFSNVNAGCIIPPCATLSPASPTPANPLFVQSFPIAGATTFNWVTNCAHVEGLDTNCRRILNTYNFVIKATDNYCPANASNVATISVTILPAPKLDPPVLRCASVNLDGSVALSWTKPTPRDSQNTFHSYGIYAALAAGGPWLLIDSVLTAYNSPASYTYTHTNANLMAQFGVNAQQQSVFYRLVTRSGCRGDSLSNPSNVIQTIKLNAVLNGSNEAVLTWNPLCLPPLSSHAGRKYMIHKEYPLGTWTLIDSTLLLTYTDTTTKQLCTGTINYRVSLSDSSGCVSWSSIDQVNVVNPNPVVTIVPANPSYCNTPGAFVTLTCSTPALTYLWNTGAGTASINVSSTGTYTVTITQAGGCTSTGSTSVTVNQPPTPAIVGNNVICNGQSTTFDAGAGFTYLWSNTATTQTINVGTAGTYTVTVTDANGCTGTATRTLTVNPNPAPSITGITSICQGQNTTLNAGAGYFAYQWTGGAGAATQTYNVNTTGTYTVTVTNNFGCTGTTSSAVTVNPLPTPTITGTLAFCQGSNTTLNAGAGYAGYQWSAGLGTNQTINVTGASTFTVTVTDANGCTNSTSATTVVNPNPVPVIVGNNVICSGQATTFDAGAGFTYLWSNTATTQSINIGTAGTYTVTVTDANGCTGTATRTLTVNPNPTPSITGTTTFCQGQNSNLNAGAGYFAYQWTGGAGAATQVYNVTTGGTYTVTVTNNFGCTGTTSALVTVNPLPSPSITGNLAFCQGTSTTLDAGAGYTNYQWSAGLGSNQTINVTGASTFTVTVTDVNGCVNSTSATTTVNPNPVPVISGTFSTCSGQTTQINAGAGYSGYAWSTGANTQTINIGTAGPVSVTVTDANGCSGTASTSITVFALPSATISGVDTICFGQGTSFNIAFAGPGPYTYTWFDGTSNQGPVTTGAASVNIPVSPTGNTNYTLVSVSNSNCIGTIAGQANVVVTPLPSATISGTTAICNGNNTNLTINFTGVAPYTYSYTAGATVIGPFTTNNNSATINVAPTSTTTYGLTATVTGAGCVGATNVATAIVTVNPLPSATITGNNTICNGTTTDLTLNFVGTGPYTYSYSNGASTFGPFTTPNNPATVTVSPGLTTTYSMLTVSDANCAGSVSGSALVTVNPLPSATMSGTASICDGTNTNLSVLFTGTGPFTYSYNDGSSVYGPFVTSQNPVLINVSPLVNTTYGVTTVSDANCVGSGAGSAAITVIPLPTSTLTGTTEICRGSSTNMNLTFTGVPPFEYSYTDGLSIFGPFTSNNFTATIPVSPNNTTSYNVTFVTGAGCYGTPAGVVDITVNDIPQAEAVLSGNAVICDGENSQFNINFTGIAPYTYTYTDGSGTFGPFTTSNNPEIIPVTPGLTTTYTLVNMSDDKCPGTTSGAAMVTVNPLPVATVSGNPSICYGSGTTFTVGFTGTGPYTYTYTDGTTTYGPFTTPNATEIIPVSPLISTSYNVLTVSDANCVGSATGVASVTVNQIPTASISGDAMICIGQSTNLNISFNGVAPFTYTYTNGVTTIGPVITGNSNVTIPVSPGATTTYSLVSLNDANCPGTLSGSAEVWVNPLPQPAITGDLVICDGESSTLTATPGFVSYVWSTGSSSTFIDVTTGGIYAVTVTDLNGCSNSTAANFIVNQTPVISFTNDTSLTCDIPKINFTNTSTYPPGSQFTWNFGDSANSTQANPSHIYQEPGTYTVSLAITTQAGCFAEASQPVDIIFFPLAQAKFTADPEATNVFNARVQFTDQSDYAVSWLWDFNDGNKSIEQNPVHYFQEIGNYKVTLIVTNVSGCPDAYVREVVVNPFYIPNAFTPNADGINDYFFNAGYVLDVKSYTLRIFNRWGQKVFEGADYNDFWNGKDSNGEPAPNGVYVYRIDVVTKGGKEHRFNGTVTLVR